MKDLRIAGTAILLFLTSCQSGDCESNELTCLQSNACISASARLTELIENPDSVDSCPNPSPPRQVDPAGSEDILADDEQYEAYELDPSKLNLSRPFWSLNRYATQDTSSPLYDNCFFTPRPDEVASALGLCDATTDNDVSVFQEYKLCDTIDSQEDVNTINRIPCGTAAEIAIALNNRLNFKNNPEFERMTTDKLRAEACQIESCKQNKVLESYCSYYEQRAASEIVPAIARQTSEAELAEISSCLNTAFGIE